MIISKIQNNCYIKPQTFTALSRKSNISDKAVANQLALIKSSCVSALKYNKPFERAVLYNRSSNVVEDEFTGSDVECPISIDSRCKNNSLEIYHGHLLQCENGIYYTNPISFTDFELFNKIPQIYKITAYDINGKESTLQKKNSFKEIPENELKQLNNELLRRLRKSLPTSVQDQLYRKLDNYERNKEDKNLLVQIYDKIISVQDSYKGAIAINKFWSDMADKYQMTYFCDYPYRAN